MTRLNLGSGGQLQPGWLHLDRAFTDETVERAALIGAPLMVWELTDLPLPFADGSVSQAVAHHSLCMLAEPDLRALVADLHRVLDTNCMLRVSSVDFQYAIRALAREDLGWFRDLGVPGDLTPVGSFVWYLDWGTARKTVLVSPEHLGVEFLGPAGFKWQQVAMNETTGSPDLCDFDSREGESWFLEARKP